MPNWLPLDDPENSARWIAEQDESTLWEELDTVIHLISQTSQYVGEKCDGWEGALEDRDHALRLAGQLMDGLKAKRGDKE